MPTLEAKQSDAGETLWPVVARDGLRYMRSIDVAALTLKEGSAMAPRSTAASESDEWVGRVPQAGYLEMLVAGDNRAHDLYGEFE